MISFKRSQPAPESLARKTSFRGRDVRKRLKGDFFGKCYLCEGPTYGTFQIEHLRPQAGFSEAVYDWNNLFPAHGDTCNQRRLHWETRDNAFQRDGEPVRWPQGGLIDCASAPDVEARLLQWFDSDVSDIAVYFEAADDNDAEARNTADELRHIHMDDTQPAARAIRDRIRSQYECVHQVLTEFLKAHADDDREAFRSKAAEFRRLTSKRAPYTALIRKTLVTRQVIPNRFRKLLGFA